MDWRERTKLHFNNHLALFLNRVEELLEEAEDRGAKEELNNLRTVIAADANIDSEDVNVKRIVNIINIFMSELEQEVDYENGPEDEGVES